MEKDDTDTQEADELSSELNDLTSKSENGQGRSLWVTLCQFFSVYHKIITGTAATLAVFALIIGYLNSTANKPIPEELGDNGAGTPPSILDKKPLNAKGKINKSEDNTTQVFTPDVTAKQVLNDPNSRARYKGWKVPEGIWFGKVYSIDKQGNQWSVYLSVEPSRTDVFVFVDYLPPNIHTGSFVEVTGIIGDVRSFIILQEGGVKAVDKNATLNKVRPNYNNIVCVQKRLKEYGYGVYYVDGIAGVNTKTAVARFLSKSPVLKELGLSASSQINDVCKVLKSVSLEDYKKLVNNKNAAALRKRYGDIYKPIDYKERYYKDLEKTDKEKFDKANKFSDLEALYEYLEQSHLKYTLGDADRLRRSKGFLERLATAQKKLGITFYPRNVDKLNKFINDDKESGVKYEVEVSIGRDKGYYFHDGKAVHGKSKCMDMRMLKNCHAGGICTEKDIKNHYYGYRGQCVNLELEYGIAGIIKLETRRHDDLCERFQNYINKKTGHKAEASISDESQGRNCFMHYSTTELNRLLSEP